MWQPDTIQVPRKLLSAELTGTVPAGTVLVYSLMEMPIQLTKEMMDQYHLSQEAGKAASAFKTTGEVVTTDGEMTPTELVVASPAENIPKSLIVQPLSTNEIKDIFKSGFPNLQPPDHKLCEQLDDWSNHDIDAVQNLCTILLNYHKKVESLPGLLLWFIKNKTVQDVADGAEHYRTMKKSPKNLINEVLRKADAQIKTMARPVANQQVVDDLDTLLGELNG